MDCPVLAKLGRGSCLFRNCISINRVVTLTLGLDLPILRRAVISNESPTKLCLNGAPRDFLFSYLGPPRGRFGFGLSAID
jgi:hypothetical protein